MPMIFAITIAVAVAKPTGRNAGVFVVCKSDAVWSIATDTIADGLGDALLYSEVPLLMVKKKHPVMPKLSMEPATQLAVFLGNRRDALGAGVRRVGPGRHQHSRARDFRYG